ncbi:unnamed protein product [Adineta steineri]|uniref:Uncharacterized protein n=1 Tax=Adineta steineri TaxID=433720 RepID=A0A819N7K3_9BILA|nr:unnamed protein product [Adineta steineri]
MKLVAIIVGCILAVVCILYIISNAVPSWVQITTGSYTSTYGLWKICASSLSVTECVPVKCSTAIGDSSFCSRILAGRAFMTLACILSGITSICLFICAFIDEKTSRILLLIAKALAFICLIMGIISVAAGGSTIQTLSQDGVKCNLSAASILGIIAIIINLVGVIASFFIKQSQK